MSKQSGYYRFPTIYGDRIVFVCEDDLWGVPVNGGVAIRLTSNLGEVSHPFLSPDGTQLAFIGKEEGHPEVYVMPSNGGVAKRLTFLGANTTVVGWSSNASSIIFASNAAQPFRLNTLGANIQVGDLLLWVGGQRVGRQISPQELLVHKANSEVNLTFAGRNSEEYRTITVKTLDGDSKLRYREWVERNRQIVREKTGDRVGYLHIPDMDPDGYAEFHRYYGVEVEQEALIVDVRYNGGGHVSQLLLEKLARKRIGYSISRWGQPEPYPADSLAGLMVAITNEQAGSDGDIFSHCFKLMKLGTLIGKRTWGGVIGIWPRHALVDGSVLTQPEFSFWFKDVAWKVENYGTDPDIEVDIAPQDWAQGKDPQLDSAIELILQQLQEYPVKLPEFGERPILKLPD